MTDRDIVQRAEAHEELVALLADPDIADLADDGLPGAPFSGPDLAVLVKFKVEIETDAPAAEVKIRIEDDLRVAHAVDRRGADHRAEEQTAGRGRDRARRA